MFQAKKSRGDFLKISVAICTYNGEKYIEKQLKSIIEQIRKVDEIIISDDNSKDSTLLLCEEILKNSEINYKIIRNEKALGVMKNFQQCFSLCSGDIIFSCDQDDMWEPNKVEVIESYFQDQPEISLIASDATLIDATDKEMDLTLKQSLGFNVDENNPIFNNLLRTYCITGATMAFRKTFQQQYFHVSKYWLHDGYMALVAAMQDGLLYLNQKLTRYRLHGNNECGVGNVDLLMSGTTSQLHNARERGVIKTSLRSPFYFEDFAKERMEMYEEIKTQFEINGWDANAVHMIELTRCIEFWNERRNIRHMSRKECWSMIHRMKINNEYEKYSESPKYAFFDKYFWIVYKLIPRRSKK